MNKTVPPPNKTTPEIKVESSLKWYHLLIFVGVVVLWLMSWWYVERYQKASGTFGDMFGFVNSMFSGLAFAGIIITILLQSDELKEQRIELRLTRDTLINNLN